MTNNTTENSDNEKCQGYSAPWLIAIKKAGKKWKNAVKI